MFRFGQVDFSTMTTGSISSFPVAWACMNKFVSSTSILMRTNNACPFMNATLASIKQTPKLSIVIS